MTTDIWTHTWRPEVRALLEQDQRMAEAAVGFTTPELVQISANQSLTVRKYTLETVRKRSAVQGYVITGLRDTPIATSGISMIWIGPSGSLERSDNLITMRFCVWMCGVAGTGNRAVTVPNI